ncbi:MAG: DUF1573 domain-containing protein [Pirellulales bacterium]|nr:DUF1573 domain-containing protein [Pirellulales bacterium]
MIRKAAAVMLLVGVACSTGFGQEWATKMFETKEHDFGAVARGAKAEFEFVLSNIYVEDVHVASARSSCGCTSVSIQKPLLKTYEKGAIVATLNSRSFYGRKGATITVTIDQPFYAEVQLHVTSYIRSDVVFHPGAVQFGSINQGTPAESKVAISYAGRSDWQILEVRSANPHLSGDVVETGRGNGEVRYELLVHLDSDAPVGYVRDQLVLVTNDRNATQVPVLVEAKIDSPVAASPTSLFMGVVQPGQKVTKPLVIRAGKPFRILSVSCDDASFEFDTSSETEAKAIHVIPVTFVAGVDPGKVVKTIRVETDLGESLPDLSAYAVVAAP